MKVRQNSVAFFLLMLISTASAQETAEQRLSRLEYEVSKNRAREIFRSQLPLPPASVPKAIYGPDNRADIITLNAADIGRIVGPSTCILTNKSRVTKQGNQYALTLEDYEQQGFSCCQGERFESQKVGGWCSGFLVGKDVVVTAGHCTDPTDASVKGIAFVFGFAVNGAGATPSTIAESGVYFGKKVIKHRLDTEGDFAIVQLDRPVPAAVAKPLNVAAVAPGVNSAIILVGYPSGLPCKAAGGAKVMEQVSGGSWLRTNLDAYGGNSGSPVVDGNGEVIGILVRGRSDFELKTVSGTTCFESTRYEETDGGEIVTRTELFKTHISAP